MKRIYIFLAAIILAVTGLSAQTDVTRVFVFSMPNSYV